MATPNDLSSERGINQTFTCTASGGPGNMFTWSRLLDDMIISRTNNLSLLVDNADIGGYYRCTVENDAGNETDDVILRGIYINSS